MADTLREKQVASQTDQTAIEFGDVFRSAETFRRKTMNCSTFETQISNYLDGLLSKPEADRFREHSLQCRTCRALIDEVREALGLCKQEDELETPAVLEASLSTIVPEHVPLSCADFEELITEFLDGYVPASAYHRFEAHSDSCCECSSLLTDVVYAVAACHSVHTYEEVEAPDALLNHLVAIMPANKRRLSQVVSARMVALAARVIPNRTQSARWSFGTAVSIAFASVAFLLIGFSDDGSVHGLYRQANRQAAELYSRGADIYAEREQVAARIERVGMSIGELWDTIGGESKPASQEHPTAQREPDSTKSPADLQRE